MSKVFSHPAALGNMVQRIAVEAGEIILDYYDESGFAGAELKGDGSPVTEADTKAEHYIINALRDISADIPVIGEETCPEMLNKNFGEKEFFWLVDPLDGTREFVRGGEDFTVNIALIKHGVPIMGVVYAPAKGELYGGHEELGAVRWLEETNNQKEIRVRQVPKGGHTVVISHFRDYGSTLDNFLADYKVEKIVRRSSSLKICAIAYGKADLYPGFGATCEWDTAAGHAILRAAGGDITDLQGNTLTYGHSERKFINPDFVAAKDYVPIVNEE